MKIINRQIKIIPKVKVNIRYIIKEEERIIIAIAKFKNADEFSYFRDSYFKLKDKYKNRWSNNDNSNDELLVLNYLENYCRDYGFTPSWNSSVHNKLKMSPVYTSTAKCDPKDEWDEQTGIDIVTEKIALKVANAFDKRMEFALRMFKDAAMKL